MATCGGIHNIPQENNVEMEEFARFAVEEYNKKENVLLKFGRLLKAQKQVVAGILYYLTLKAIEGDEEKTYEAKVLLKPREKFKELEEFKQVRDSTTPSSASA